VGCGQNDPQRLLGANGLDGGNEEQRHQRLYDDLRKKLLDLSRRNPMLNYKHRAGSRRQLRIVHNNLENVFAELTANQKELPFAALPEPDDVPEDELTEAFKSALGQTRGTGSSERSLGRFRTR
jgi:hypothetical protein